MTDRLSQSAFDGPAALESIRECQAVHSEVSSPIRDVHPLAAVFNVVIAVGVAALFFICGPSAISGLVVAVTVNTVERSTEWAVPHVGKERREVIAPAVAHGDTPTAVSGIRLVTRLEATLLGSGPGAMLPRAGQSVRGVLTGAPLSTNTAATLRPSRCQTPTHHVNLASATTPASPSERAAAISATTKYDESSECYPRQVDGQHFLIINQISPVGVIVHG